MQQPELTNDSLSEEEQEKRQAQENLRFRNENIYNQPPVRFPVPSAPHVVEEKKINAKTAFQTIRSVTLQFCATHKFVKFVHFDLNEFENLSTRLWHSTPRLGLEFKIYDFRNLLFVSFIFFFVLIRTLRKLRWTSGNFFGHRDFVYILRPIHIWAADGSFFETLRFKNRVERFMAKPKVSRLEGIVLKIDYRKLRLIGKVTRICLSFRFEIYVYNKIINYVTSRDVYNKYNNYIIE